MPFAVGVRRLSGLLIDVDKDWGLKDITNLDVLDMATMQSGGTALLKKTAGGQFWVQTQTLYLLDPAGIIDWWNWIFVKRNGNNLEFYTKAAINDAVLRLVLKGGAAQGAAGLDSYEPWDMKTQKITNLGAPTVDTDAPRARAGDILSGRFGMARMPAGPSNQVLTGQGAGVDPAYAASIKYTEANPHVAFTPTNADTWQNWDLSAYIPAGAIACVITALYADTVVRKAGARKSGSTVDNTLYLQYGIATFIVELASTRIIEVRGDSNGSRPHEYWGYFK